MKLFGYEILLRRLSPPEAVAHTGKVERLRSAPLPTQCSGLLSFPLEEDRNVYLEYLADSGRATSLNTALSRLDMLSGDANLAIFKQIVIHKNDFTPSLLADMSEVINRKFERLSK